MTEPFSPQSQVEVENLLSDLHLALFTCTRQDKPTLTLDPVVTPGLEPLMSQLNSWNFPIFSLVEKTHGETGSILSQVGVRGKFCFGCSYQLNEAVVYISKKNKTCS